MAIDLPASLLWLRAKDLAGAAGDSVSTWSDRSHPNGFATRLHSGTAPTISTTDTPPNGGKSLYFAGNGSLSLNNGLNNAGPLRVTGSSSDYPSGSYQYGATHACDGVSSTYWASEGAPSVGVPQWLQVTPLIPTVATSYEITIDFIGGRNPKDWTFQGSDNGTDWTTLDTRSGETSWTNGVKRQFTFSNSTAFKHYRPRITSAGDLVWISDFRLNDVANSSTVSHGDAFIVLRTTNTVDGGFPLRGSGGQDLRYLYGNSIYAAWGDSSGRAVWDPVADVTQWHVLRMSASGVDTIYEIDGVPEFTRTGQTPSWLPYLVTQGGVNFKGYIAEVLVFDHVLNGSELDAVRNYLRYEHFEAPPSAVSRRGWGIPLN